MHDFYYEEKHEFSLHCCPAKDEINTILLERFGLKTTDYYLLSHGKRLAEVENASQSKIHVIPRLVGGKGGFGSMLRAIGAQIEKTTNREACRDLSGRRLRDINEEKRLKEWIDQQAEREREQAEKKLKKLERLCEKPKHEFKDDTYDKERSELPERIVDAFEQGMVASSEASTSGKRKVDTTAPIKKKKKKMWLDDFDDDLSTSEDDEDIKTSDKAEIKTVEVI